MGYQEPKPLSALSEATQRAAALALFPACDCESSCDCWEHLQLLRYAALGYQLSDKQGVIVDELIELFGGAK